MNSFGGKGRGGKWLEGVTVSQSPFLMQRPYAGVIVIDKSVNIIPKTFA